MKKILIFVLMFLFIASVAFAAQATDPVKKNPSSAQLAQQEKMKSCNKEATAKALKGEERKAFMKNCLSGGAEPDATKMTKQDKMEACNKEASAKAFKGDERKKFMSDCLKKM
ncbi:MAG TPA: PsiF family protein [Syntrophales bacterium]|nr:PsiF family protein [Syntrophales bacterium]